MILSPNRERLPGVRSRRPRGSRVGLGLLLIALGVAAGVTAYLIR